jgi:hypothetical protein
MYVPPSSPRILFGSGCPEIWFAAAPERFVVSLFVLVLAVMILGSEPGAPFFGRPLGTLATMPNHPRMSPSVFAISFCYLVCIFVERSFSFLEYFEARTMAVQTVDLPKSIHIYIWHAPTTKSKLKRGYEKLTLRAIQSHPLFYSIL